MSKTPNPPFFWNNDQDEPEGLEPHVLFINETARRIAGGFLYSEGDKWPYSLESATKSVIDEPSKYNAEQRRIFSVIGRELMTLAKLQFEGQWITDDDWSFTVQTDPSDPGKFIFTLGHPVLTEGCGITVEETNTLPPGEDASVTIDENCALTFNIPRGQTGATGGTGATGEKGDKGDKGDTGKNGGEIDPPEPHTEDNTNEVRCGVAQRCCQFLNNVFDDNLSAVDFTGSIASAANAIPSVITAALFASGAVWVGYIGIGVAVTALATTLISAGKAYLQAEYNNAARDKVVENLYCLLKQYNSVTITPEIMEDWKRDNLEDVSGLAGQAVNNTIDAITVEVFQHIANIGALEPSAVCEAAYNCDEDPPECGFTYDFKQSPHGFRIEIPGELDLPLAPAGGKYTHGKGFEAGTPTEPPPYARALSILINFDEPLPEGMIFRWFFANTGNFEVAASGENGDIGYAGSIVGAHTEEDGAFIQHNVQNQTRVALVTNNGYAVEWYVYKIEVVCP